MSIRPRLGVEVPELTARVARASNPAGTTAMWVRDRLDGLWADEDFAGWYPRDGRPGISPAQLATVSVLQWPSNRCGGCPGSRGAGVLRIRALGKRSASRRAEASGLLSRSACQLAGSSVRLLSFGRVRVVDQCFRADHRR